MTVNFSGNTILALKARDFPIFGDANEWLDHPRAMGYADGNISLAG